MTYVTRLNWLWRSRKFAELAALAEAELPKLSFLGETSALKLQWGEALQRLDHQTESAVLFADALDLARDIATRPLIDPTANDPRLGRALALSGRGDEAIAALRRAVEGTPPETRQSDRWERQSKLAELYATLGHTRECVELLAELLRVPSGLTVPMLRLDPAWDAVRSDAGFKALLADQKNSAPL